MPRARCRRQKLRARRSTRALAERAASTGSDIGRRGRKRSTKRTWRSDRDDCRRGRSCRRQERTDLRPRADRRALQSRGRLQSRPPNDFLHARGAFPATRLHKLRPAAPGAPPVTGADAALLGGLSPRKYRIQCVDTAGRVTPDGDRSGHPRRRAIRGRAGVARRPRCAHDGVIRPTTPHDGGDPVTSPGATCGSARGPSTIAPWQRPRSAIRQRGLSGDSVVGEMSTGRHGVRRPIARQLPSGDLRPVSLRSRSRRLGLVGVRLSPGWRGSVSIVGWAVVPSDAFYPVTLRVVGEEKLSTSGRPR